MNSSVRGRDPNFGDEDVDETLGALLPAGGGADAGDSGQGAEQVERVDVEPDVAFETARSTRDAIVAFTCAPDSA